MDAGTRGHRPSVSRRLWRCLGLTVLLATVSATPAAATTGGLVQKPGLAGCVRQAGLGFGCTDGFGIDRPSAVAVSPDGRHVYAAASAGRALAILDRDPATGALTQKAGTAGCISEDGSGGSGARCVDGVSLDSPHSVVVTADGESVYVTAGTNVVAGSVAVFDRDLATGTLTQKPGTAGCVSEDGSGGTCADGRALGGASSMTVSPDGKSAYVTSGNTSGGVAILDRDPATGALTQKAGTAGCVSNDGAGGACTDGTALGSARSVAVSPDGSSVYVASSYPGAVAVFDRAADGALTQKPGSAGCVKRVASFGAGACVDAPGLARVSGVTVSPDGRSVYVSSAVDAVAYYGGVAIFDRDPLTGALSQKLGTAGCISEDRSGGGVEGACGKGVAILYPESVTVSPDGKSVYVPSGAGGSLNGGAVAILDRDTSTGALTQPAGTAACISLGGSGGACADGVGLSGTSAVAVSPDNGNVYAAGGGFSPLIGADPSALTIFDRETVPGQLRVNRAGSGQGAVASSPAGIDCGADCAEFFTPGATVTLSATPAGASGFAGFLGGGCSGTGTTCTVSMEGARSVTGTFTAGPILKVTMAGAGAGAVTSSPAGIDCGADCTQEYRNGTTVTLTPTAGAGSSFAGFLGGGCSGVTAACVVTLDQARSVTATFIRDQAGPPVDPPRQGAQPGGPDVTAPVVSAYGLSNRVFSVGQRTPRFGVAALVLGAAEFGHAREPKRGTVFRYTLSEAASVKIVIARRRSGGRARLVVRGTVTRTGRQGPNRVAFSGRIGSKALSPGRYRATLTATDPSKNSSGPKAVSFSIVRG